MILPAFRKEWKLLGMQGDSCITYISFLIQSFRFHPPSLPLASSKLHQSTLIFANELESFSFDKLKAAQKFLQ